MMSPEDARYLKR